MSFEQPDGDRQDRHAPRFEVRIGDETFSELSNTISDLMVDSAVGMAGRCSFNLNYPYDRRTETSGGIEDGPVEINQTVSISAGYDNSLTPIFSGKIRSMSTRFSAGGGPVVQVSGQGPLDEMMRGTKARLWNEETDSAVAEAVASAYFGGANVEVESTGIVHQQINQNNQTDFQFLEELANRNGFEIVVRRGTFSFGPARKTEPVATLSHGESLTAFTLDRRSAHQVGAVEVRHWDPKRNEEIVGTAEREGVGTEKKVIKRPVWSREEATRLAKAELKRLTGNDAQGTGETLGTPKLWAGDTVRLEGLGALSDTYYFERVTHRISESGFTTSFEVSPLIDGGRSVVTDEVTTVASGPDESGGRVRGVAVGVVSEIVDPDKMGRVKLTFPWRDANDESYWARVSTLMAGAESGTYFLPDPGDEVLVGFDEGDIRHPYVLGRVWNGQKKPPITPDEENNLRKIASRSGHELVFDDSPNDGKVELLSRNRDGRQHRISLQDSKERTRIILEDQSGKNTVEIDKDGMHFSSASKIEIKAPQLNITDANGKNGIMLDKSGNLTLKGTNIHLNPPGG